MPLCSATIYLHQALYSNRGSHTRICGHQLIFAFLTWQGALKTWTEEECSSAATLVTVTILRILRPLNHRRTPRRPKRPPLVKCRRALAVSVCVCVCACKVKWRSFGFTWSWWGSTRSEVGGVLKCLKTVCVRVWLVYLVGWFWWSVKEGRCTIQL